MFYPWHKLQMWQEAIGRAGLSQSLLFLTVMSMEVDMEVEDQLIFHLTLARVYHPLNPLL